MNEIEQDVNRGVIGGLIPTTLTMGHRTRQFASFRAGRVSTPREIEL